MNPGTSFPKTRALAAGKHTAILRNAVWQQCGRLGELEKLLKLWAPGDLIRRILHFLLMIFSSCDFLMTCSNFYHIHSFACFFGQRRCSGLVVGS